MKFKKFSFTAVAVSIIVTLFIFLFNTTNRSNNNLISSFITLPISDTAFGGLFFNPTFPENLPYSAYSIIEKNYSEKKEKKKIINEGDFQNGLSFGFFGVRNSPIILDSIELPINLIVEDTSKVLSKKMEMLIDSLKKEKNLEKIGKYTSKYDSLKNLNDSLEIKNFETNCIKQSCKYYLSLSGYEFKESETKFYVDKGTYNLAVVNWKNRDTLNNNYRVGEYKIKPIDIIYSSKNKEILIPISQNNYSLLKNCLMIIITILSCLGLYFFIGLPFQVLLNISRGFAFCKDNIKYIKQTTIFTTILYLITLILPYIFNLIFYNKIPEEIYNNTFQTTLWKNIYGLITIIALLLIKKAFEKGYNLQNEQDLTV